MKIIKQIINVIFKLNTSDLCQFERGNDFWRWKIKLTIRDDTRLEMWTKQQCFLFCFLFSDFLKKIQNNILIIYWPKTIYHKVILS